jgi:hypothetical protein
MNLTSIQEMMHMEPRFGMVTTLYCYDEFEPDDEKEDCDINDIVEKDENNEPINQIMRPPVPEFEDASGFGYMMSFDWILSHKNSDLSIELNKYSEPRVI